MERTGHLIEKLLDDYRNNATPAQLLITLQLIQKELVMHHAQAIERGPGKRIAVIMPGQVHDGVASDPEEMTLTFKPEPVVSEEIPVPITINEPVLPKTVMVEPVKEPEIKQQPAVITETRQEIHQAIPAAGASLHERLATAETKELAEVLNGEPLKDLKKGIGVNDRYVFVNDLFRGDETMYERSIKTINGFNIYAEAQYWIERELKIKLGWNDDQPIVKQFYALVKRRFS
ncbi:MAG: hypothetical protein JNM68_11790 [Dinghuibacter sp.]|nr:hypothetical protein [Dinghuibacter sp.]